MGMTLFGMRRRGIEYESDDYDLLPGPGRLVGGMQSLHYKCNGCYVSYKGHLAEHAIRHKIAEGVNMM